MCTTNEAKIPTSKDVAKLWYLYIKYLCLENHFFAGEYLLHVVCLTCNHHNNNDDDRMKDTITDTLCTTRFLIVLWCLPQTRRYMNSFLRKIIYAFTLTYTILIFIMLPAINTSYLSYYINFIYVRYIVSKYWNKYKKIHF